MVPVLAVAEPEIAFEQKMELFVLNFTSISKTALGYLVGNICFQLPMNWWRGSFSSTLAALAAGMRIVGSSRSR
jgi:hypothetical protein